MVRYLLIGISVSLLPFSVCAQESLLELRQAYNVVVAEIDSVVRVMALKDTEALESKRLPDGPEGGLVPEDMAVVMIFWADDEAQVWVNDFLVGETRLTPVEVEVPSLYLKAKNRIRARCWDTDWVESGFMCGMYLRDQAGALHPIVVSDGQWEAGEGSVMEITYAHPSPDIPGAEPIWGTKVFGVVEFSVAFDGQAVRKAASRAGVKGGVPKKAQRRKMDYHRFLQHLVVLQERRTALKRTLEAQAEGLNIPVSTGQKGRSPGLTLGKAGPLKEAVSKPLAEETTAWAQELPKVQNQLIYPEKRALKGEGLATAGSDVDVATEGESGQRQRAYQQPEERGAAPPGSKRGEKGGGEGGAGAQGPGGGTEGTGGEGAGFFGGGPATRWGLLIPTLILGVYVGYLAAHWKEVRGEK